MVRHDQSHIVQPLNLTQRCTIYVALEGDICLSMPVTLAPCGHGKLMRGEVTGREVTFLVHFRLFTLEAILGERLPFEPASMMREALLPVANIAVEIQPHVIRQGFGIRLA